MRRYPLLLLISLCGSAFAQAQGGRVEFQDDVPIDTYLALLAQVAPPARDGAEAYMAAFRSRCGRSLRAVELRRALAEGNGDPVLMGMIRASQLRDAKSVAELARRIDCGSRR